MQRDERFKVERYYRTARRGGGGVVQDGWILTDTLTGNYGRYSLKSDTTEAIENTLRVEEEIRERLSEIKWWDGDLEHRTMVPQVEIYLYDGDGAKMKFERGRGSVATLVERAYAPMRLVEWLREMGLSDLQRRITP